MRDVPCPVHSQRKSRAQAHALLLMDIPMLGEGRACRQLWESLAPGKMKKLPQGRVQVMRL
jgi:hypothetical protein